MIDAYVKRIRIIAAECKYGADTLQEQIIDTLIFGAASERIQSKLLQKEESLTLDQALEIARIEEATRRQIDELHDKSVHILQTEPRFREQHSKQLNQLPQRKGCYNCGTVHGRNPNSCPAKGAKCNFCGKLNHWKRVCFAKKSQEQSETKSNPQQQTQASVNEIQTDQSEPSQPLDLYFHALYIHGMSHESWKKDNETTWHIDLPIQLQTQPMHVKCKIDTGAEGNVMPLSMYKKLAHIDKQNGFSPTEITPSNVRITAFGGSSVKLVGVCNMKITHKDTTEAVTFYIVNPEGPVILGLPTCRRLGLVTLNYMMNADHSVSTPCSLSSIIGDQQARKQILNTFSDVFEGIGCFEGDYHITVDPSVPPVIHPPRRIPVALRDSLKGELDSLVEKGILSPVTQPTDWVNSFVCITKPNGKIRLCLDPKDLNRAIKRPHYYTPTLEDVLPKLSGARWFSILDARSGYWNISLDEESSLLTTFNTPFGRYKYNRLPFGLSVAQDVFQRKIDETFGDIPGCFGIADDLVIAGWQEDGKDHDETLHAVLQRVRNTGTRFNDEKMVIRCKQIPFFGHIIGEDGVKPDPSKVDAIENMTSPSNLTQLQPFLGMVNYLSRFSSQLAMLTAPLRDLCKKSNEFIWGPEHDQAFTNVKKEITSLPNLQFYNSQKPLTLQVDASLEGIGAALIQDNGPVAFASKAMTDTEQRYSNIEREMLAIVFGLERFHHYVYGRKVRVETDHKPLEAIVKKHLHNAPPRLARMLLRILCYDIEVVYVPGTDIPLADALSRVNPCETGIIPGLDISVHELHDHINASPTRIEQLREETDKDSELHALREIIHVGWPNQRIDCPEQLKEYWNYRDELAIADGIILKGTRFIVPKSLQGDVLKQLHYAHQGVEKCRLRAKASVFWKGINEDIERTVGLCPTCQRHQNAPSKEPLMPMDIPPHQWHTLGSDLFYLDGQDYLLIADYYSKFPIVRKLTQTSSRNIIAQLKGIFEEQGIPRKLISDNGPQYTSQEFQHFTAEWKFEHVTSSPYYPQSNGFIERMVQTVKQTLTKAKETGSDPHMAMLCLRTTPIDHNTAAPCELLNGRRYQSNVPAMSSLNTGTGYKATLQQSQDKCKTYYDAHSKALPPLHVQEDVRVFDQHTKTWNPGKVVGIAPTPRSYHVSTTNGVYRRNRRHIRKTLEQFEPDSTITNPQVDNDLPDQELSCVDLPHNIKMKQSQV